MPGYKKNRSEDAALESLGLGKNAKAFARKVIAREIDPYINLKRAKASGGKPRSISAPISQLAEIQKLLLTYLEESVRKGHATKTIVHKTAHAYTRHKSHISAASVHLGMQWGVKVDLKQFYDHITEDHIFKALQAAGLEEKAFYFARLCSRVPKNWPGDLPPKYTKLKRALLFKEIANGQDPWFAVSRPPRRVAYKVRFGKNSASAADSRFVRFLPPKHLPRLFPVLKEGKHAADYYGNKLDMHFAFYKLRSLLKLPESGQKSVGIYRSARTSRRQWRSRILSSYSNATTFRYISNNEEQKFYPPRPEQYRDFYKLGFLPQGSPTSGILSNMVMAKFDEILFAFCKENSFRYTRYSDDIVVSAYGSSYSRDKALEIISFIQKLAEINGFTLNKDKTRIIGPNSRKFVLGVLVDGKQVRLGRHERDRIERTIYQIAKFGDFWTDSPATTNLLNASHKLPGKRLGPKSRPSTPSSPLESLLGWLSYCKPADFVFLRKIHDQLLGDKWDFMDQTHWQIIINHTSTLLGDEKNKVPARTNEQSNVSRGSINPWL